MNWLDFGMLLGIYAIIKIMLEFILRGNKINKAKAQELAIKNDPTLVIEKDEIVKMPKKLTFKKVLCVIFKSILEGAVLAFIVCFRDIPSWLVIFTFAAANTMISVLFIFVDDEKYAELIESTETLNKEVEEEIDRLAATDEVDEAEKDKLKEPFTVNKVVAVTAISVFIMYAIFGLVLVFGFIPLYNLCG